MKITIPTPSELVRRRGIYSTGKYGGNLRVRCTNLEYDLICSEARHLGISASGFTRWCTVRVAELLKNHRDQHLNTTEAEDDLEEPIDVTSKEGFRI